MNSSIQSERKWPHEAGFTLIEVMAAIFLTSMVITFAVSFYLDLANASQSANIRARQALRAASAIDRVARDLANTAFIVKAEEADPLLHPRHPRRHRQDPGPQQKHKVKYPAMMTF